MLQFHENEDTPTPRKNTSIPSATKEHMHGQTHSYRGSRTHNNMRHKSCEFNTGDLHRTLRTIMFLQPTVVLDKRLFWISQPIWRKF